MNAIIFQNGIYVYIQDPNDEQHYPIPHEGNIEAINKDKNIIIMNSGNIRKDRTMLYGGRVEVASTQRGRNYSIEIDGIIIYGNINKNHDYKLYYIDGCLPPSTVVSILNQIEQLGIDAVMKNYRDIIQKQQDELIETLNKIKNYPESQEITKDEQAQLKFFPDIIEIISGVLYYLALILATGIELAQYVNAYEDAIITYFN